MSETDCPGCGATMTDDGFNGNYAVFECPDCSITKEIPHGEISSEGVTMEDLQLISEFNDD